MVCFLKSRNDGKDAKDKDKQDPVRGFGYIIAKNARKLVF